MATIPTKELSPKEKLDKLIEAAKLSERLTVLNELRKWSLCLTGMRQEDVKRFAEFNHKLDLMDPTLSEPKGD